MLKGDKSDFHSFVGYGHTCVSGCVQTTENRSGKMNCIQITWTNYTELKFPLRLEKKAHLKVCRKINGLGSIFFKELSR